VYTYTHLHIYKYVYIHIINIYKCINSDKYEEVGNSYRTSTLLEKMSKILRKFKLQKYKSKNQIIEENNIGVFNDDSSDDENYDNEGKIFYCISMKCGYEYTYI
jgi:hypothetical protein